MSDATFYIKYFHSSETINTLNSRELKPLQTSGYVTVVKESVGSRNRYVATLTEAGKQFLAETLEADRVKRESFKNKKSAIAHKLNNALVKTGATKFKLDALMENIVGSALIVKPDGTIWTSPNFGRSGAMVTPDEMLEAIAISNALKEANNG